MKINKNSTLAFIGGIMLASSASMFAASTTTINNNSTNNKHGRTEARHSRGHRGSKAGDNASSTMGTNDHGMDMMRYEGMVNYGGAMKNMTDLDRQAIKDKMNSNLAQILGISKETLLAKIATSTTIQQLINDSGLTEKQFHTKMEALRKADLEKVLADQVASGKITQTKADEIKAKMAQREANKKTHMDNASSTIMKGKMMSAWFH